MQVITVVLKSGLEILGRFAEDQTPQLAVDDEGNICVTQLQQAEPTVTEPNPQPEMMMLPLIVLEKPLRQLAVPGPKGMVNALVPVSAFSPSPDMLPIQCSDILFISAVHETVEANYIKITSPLDLPTPAASRIVTAAG